MKFHFLFCFFFQPPPPHELRIVVLFQFSPPLGVRMVGVCPSKSYSMMVIILVRCVFFVNKSLSFKSRVYESRFVKLEDNIYSKYIYFDISWRT